jgi:DNA polymerase alpha-associated DNA helicase A
MTQPSKPVPIDNLESFDPSLNESQKNAVRFALEAAEVALIHGPPGVCCNIYLCRIALCTYDGDG